MNDHTQLPRIARERRTILAMIGLYCRSRGHVRKGLCAGCEELADYAEARIRQCPYGPEKPTCVKCPIHCYRPAMRERVKEVMRTAGPRMLPRHPLLAIAHMLDGRRPAPPLPRRRPQS